MHSLLVNCVCEQNLLVNQNPQFTSNKRLPWNYQNAVAYVSCNWPVLMCEKGCYLVVMHISHDLNGFDLCSLIKTEFQQVVTTAGLTEGYIAWHLISCCVALRALSALNKLRPAVSCLQPVWECFLPVSRTSGRVCALPQASEKYTGHTGVPEVFKRLSALVCVCVCVSAEHCVKWNSFRLLNKLEWKCLA